MLSVRSDCGVLIEACALPPSEVPGPISREALAIKKLGVLAVLGGNRHCRITIREQKHEVLPLCCSYLEAVPLDPASPITTQLQVGHTPDQLPSPVQRMSFGPRFAPVAERGYIAVWQHLSVNVVSLFSEDVASMLRNRVQHQAVRTMGASLSDTYMQVGTTEKIP
jgi:hypothetical protein